MLIDTHCHLAFPQFADGLDDLVSSAAEAGVSKLITIGTDLEDSRTNIELAERFPGVVFATVGIHPTTAEEFTILSVSKRSGDSAEKAGC